MADAVLRLLDVSLVLGDTLVLDRVDWEVRPGERWVVLGPNGAGKTTLLRIAALYQHPTRGDVEVLGRRLGRTDVRTLREHVAFASPALAAALEPRMTAREVVMTARYAALAPWWHTYTAADAARADELLTRFGCAHIADHAFATLSAGERQRCLLARTLVNEPGVVLFDEPTAGLDIGGREELVRDMTEWAQDASRPPIVLVTHHVEEIPPGFSHALVLRGGRVHTAGALAETVTSHVLSEAFGVDLVVDAAGGRYRARLR